MRMCLLHTQVNEGKFGLAEIEAPGGYIRDEEIWYFELAEDNQIFYGHNMYPEDYEINDNTKFANRQTRHVFSKTDFISGALLDGAVLEVLEITGTDPDGNYITKQVERWISDKAEIHYFYNLNGILMELADKEDLPEGSELITKQGHLIKGLKEGVQYLFREITAPYGYVGYDWLDDEVREANREENLVTEEIRFTVVGDSVVAEHQMFDQQVVGNIEVTKEGEFLVSADSTDKAASGYFYTDFDYQLGCVSGAAFEVYVKDTIYNADQTGAVAMYNGVELIKDALVVTIVTDQTGIAKLEGLPLGSYIIKEVKAGGGNFLLNPMTVEVVLAYAGQTVPVVMDQTAEYINDRQKIELTVIKKSRYEEEYEHLNTGETAPELQEDLLLAGAVFGLYTGNDIFGFEMDPETKVVTPKEGAMIAADTLVETSVTDMDGIARFISDLPCGRYYVKELDAPDGYLHSDEVYLFDASYTGQDGDAVLRFFHEFYNKPVITEFGKTDAADDQALAGAVLQVIDPHGRVVEEWISDGTPHYVKHLHLDIAYTLHEVSAPDGYATAEDVVFKITQDTDEAGLHLPTTTLWVQQMVDGHVHGAKGVIHAPYEYTDGYYTYKPGDTVAAQLVAQWEVIDDILIIHIDPEATEAAITKALREDLFTDLAFKQVYIAGGKSKIFAHLQMTQSPVWNTPETVWIKAEDRILMKDERIKLEVTKTDVANGDPVEGAILYIQDAAGNIVDRWKTTEETHYIEFLKPGEYLLVEERAPENSYYSKAEPIRFTVSDSGDLQTVSMMEDIIRISVTKVDANTGDRLVGAELAVLEYSSPGIHGREVATWTSDGSVRIFGYLTPGMYYLQERVAPEGYMLSEGINFTVYDTYETQEIVLVNKKLPPMTGDTSDISGSLIGMGVGLAGVLLAVNKKKKYKK